MRIAAIVLAALALSSCGDPPAEVNDADAAFQKALQLKLIQAKAGDVIEMEEVDGRWRVRCQSANRRKLLARGILSASNAQHAKAP